MSSRRCSALWHVLLVLVGLLALVAPALGAASAETSASSEAGGKGSTAKKSSKGSFHSSATCKSVAKAWATSRARSAHVSAVAEALAKACGKDVSAYAIADAYAESAAKAVARVTTSAQVQSVTSGNGFCCGTARASASAWARAIASAHAKAASEAILKHCKCQTAAKAEAFGKSSLFVALVADAFSYSEAEIDCKQKSTVWRNRQVSAAYNDCSAAAYVTIFAQATAKAIVEGKCYSKEADAKAIAEIKALAQADYRTIEKCTSYAKGDAFNTQRLIADVVEI